jgi:hypothetical protein
MLLKAPPAEQLANPPIGILRRSFPRCSGHKNQICSGLRPFFSRLLVTH